MYKNRSLFTLLNDTEKFAFADLTPLVDIVFVVLILFISISPFLETQRIHLAPAPLTQQERSSYSNPSKKSLTIRFASDNIITINDTPVDANNLIQIMTSYKRQMPNAIPAVYPSKNSLFNTYQIVKNALESAGFEEMDVILQKS